MKVLAGRSVSSGHNVLVWAPHVSGVGGRTSAEHQTEREDQLPSRTGFHLQPSHGNGQGWHRSGEGEATGPWPNIANSALTEGVLVWGLQRKPSVAFNHHMPLNPRKVINELIKKL